MPDTLYQPRVGVSLPGLLGAGICMVTGLMLMALPIAYGSLVFEGGGMNLARLSPAMLGLLGVHLVLIPIFIAPPMREKYLRSSAHWGRKIAVRAFVLAVALLLLLDGSLLFHSQTPPFPWPLPALTKDQWIMAISAWILLYFGFLFSPGVYLSALNVGYAARQLRLPFKAGVKIIGGKGYFYPLGVHSKSGLAGYAAQTGLPLVRDRAEAKAELGFTLLLLPLLPVFIGVVVALKRGTFLPNPMLLQLSNTWGIYASALLAVVLVLRAVRGRGRRDIAVAVLGPPAFFFALWPLAAERGMPILHAYLTENSTPSERFFTVLPQPGIASRISAAHCTTPLLVADSDGAAQYLCGLQSPPSAGARFGLQGQETVFGFSHSRRVAD